MVYQKGAFGLTRSEELNLVTRKQPRQIEAQPRRTVAPIDIPSWTETGQRRGGRAQACQKVWWVFWASCIPIVALSGQITIMVASTLLLYEGHLITMDKSEHAFGSLVEDKQVYRTHFHAWNAFSAGFAALGAADFLVCAVVALGVLFRMRSGKKGASMYEILCLQRTFILHPESDGSDVISYLLLGAFNCIAASCCFTATTCITITDELAHVETGDVPALRRGMQLWLSYGKYLVGTDGSVDGTGLTFGSSMLTHAQGLLTCATFFFVWQWMIGARPLYLFPVCLSSRRCTPMRSCGAPEASTTTDNTRDDETTAVYCTEVFTACQHLPGCPGGTLGCETDGGDDRKTAWQTNNVAHWLAAVWNHLHLFHFLVAGAFFLQAMTVNAHVGETRHQFARKQFFAVGSDVVMNAPVEAVLAPAGSNAGKPSSGWNPATGDPAGCAEHLSECQLPQWPGSYLIDQSSCAEPLSPNCTGGDYERFSETYNNAQREWLFGNTGVLFGYTQNGAGDPPIWTSTKASTQNDGAVSKGAEFAARVDAPFADRVSSVFWGAPTPAMLACGSHPSNMLPLFSEPGPGGFCPAENDWTRGPVPHAYPTLTPPGVGQTLDEFLKSKNNGDGVSSDAKHTTLSSASISYTSGILEDAKSVGTVWSPICYVPIATTVPNGGRSGWSQTPSNTPPPPPPAIPPQTSYTEEWPPLGRLASNPGYPPTIQPNEKVVKLLGANQFVPWNYNDWMLYWASIACGVNAPLQQDGDAPVPEFPGCGYTGISDQYSWQRNEHGTTIVNPAFYDTHDLHSSDAAQVWSMHERPVGCCQYGAFDPNANQGDACTVSQQLSNGVQAHDGMYDAMGCCIPNDATQIVMQNTCDLNMYAKAAISRDQLCFDAYHDRYASSGSDIHYCLDSDHNLEAGCQRAYGASNYNYMDDAYAAVNEEKSTPRGSWVSPCKNIPKPEWVRGDNYMHFRNLNDLLQYTLATVGAGLTEEDASTCTIPPDQTCDYAEHILNDIPFASPKVCTRCNPGAKLKKGGSNIKDTGMAQCGAAAAAQYAYSDERSFWPFRFVWTWIQSTATDYWWAGSTGGPSSAAGSLNHAMLISGVLAVLGSTVGLLARFAKLITLAGYAVSPVADSPSLSSSKRCGGFFMHLPW